MEIRKYLKRISAGLSSKYARAFLLTYIAIVGFPVRFNYLDSFDIDSIWRYAINYFSANDIVIGRDVVWTYGPMGFLILPFNIGSNMFLSTVFLVSVWALFVIILIEYSQRTKDSIIPLVILSLSFTLGVQPLYEAGHIDYFICFLGLFSLSIAVLDNRFGLHYFIAVLISALLMLIKFSTAVVLMSAMGGHLIIIAFSERSKVIEAVVYFVLGVPALFLVFYFIYDQNIIDIFTYLKGIYEITSAYGVAMSITGETKELIMSAIVLFLYVVLLIIYYKTNRRALILSFMLILPLYLLFKHGFIRHDEKHSLIFFSFTPLIITVPVFAARFDTFTRKVLIVPVLFSLFLVCYVFIGSQYQIASLTWESNVKKISSVLNYQKTKNDLEEIQDVKTLTFVMPEEIRNIIGNNKIGFLSVQLSYIAANSFDYAPFPVFQGYTASTSYLDKLNAKFLEDSVKAPKFILADTNVNTMEQRYTLVENPAVWLSLYRWYDVRYRTDLFLLLERRDIPKFTHGVLINESEVRTGDLVGIPQSAHPILARISMELNLKGKLAEVFYKVPEVWLAVYSNSGIVSAYRVSPDTLKDGIFINYLPTSFDAIDRIMNDKADLQISDFRFIGSGIDYYRDVIVVKFYELPDISIKIREK